MKRNVALLAGIAAGAAAGLLLRRRQAAAPLYPPPPPAEPDPRAEDLKRKLEEAREQAADADDFEAAGMGAETMVEEEPRPTSAPAAGEIDEARRRVHEEARAAAEEMRGDGEKN